MASNLFRVRCRCGNVVNAAPGSICEKCKNPLPFFPDALITLYRKGSPLGIAAGFEVYLNGVDMGRIGNKETIKMPVPYGTYNLHVACGMSRNCNDMKITLTPNQRFGFFKVWMKPGFWTNDFVLEVATPDEMPE